MRVPSTNKDFRIECRGQSIVEFALLIPVAFFLVYVTHYAFETNTTASHQSIQDHEDALTKFDHGNGVISIDGMEEPVATITIDIPPLPPGAVPDPLKALTDMATNTLAKMGLNALINELSFLDGKTYASGAARGATLAAGDSLIETGKISKNALAAGAAAGALSSEQATIDFQGADYTESSWQEFLGSGAQAGAIAYAENEGRWDGVAGATLGALYASDTTQNYFEPPKGAYDSENAGKELLQGAAKGAVQGTISGLIASDFTLSKMNFGDIAISTGMGAFNTRPVANLIPFSDFGNDPRQSASFSGVNAAVSVLVQGGNTEEQLYALADGAFFSRQTTDGFLGEDPGFWDEALHAGSGALYGAGKAWAQGESGWAVGASVLQSYGTTLANQEAQAFWNQYVGKNPEEKAENAGKSPYAKSQEAYRQAMGLDKTKIGLVDSS